MRRLRFNKGAGLFSMAYALGTGCYIAVYSVADSIGVRLSGAAMDAVSALRETSVLFAALIGFFSLARHRMAAGRQIIIRTGDDNV